MEPTQSSATANVPAPVFDTTITHQTNIVHGRIQLTQFPLNIADARTVHELQGRSIENLMVTTWDYTDNWIYVVLSRVRTSKGLFLKKPLLHSKAKTRGMSSENIEFHKLCRETKMPRVVED